MHIRKSSAKAHCPNTRFTCKRVERDCCCLAPVGRIHTLKGNDLPGLLDLVVVFLKVSVGSFGASVDGVGVSAARELQQSGQTFWQLLNAPQPPTREAPVSNKHTAQQTTTKR